MNITRKKIISLYKTLLFIRKVEEKIVELYPEKEMRCPVHLSIGQEGIATGICENLSKKDLIFSTHRSHAHFLAKGGDLKAFFAELYGKITGCSSGRGGSMHLIDLKAGFVASTPIVSGTIPIAVGAALEFKMRRLPFVVVVFFGEGATEEGIFHESINFALLHNLPILFACENNLYSVYTPLEERQPSRELIDVTKGHGIKSFKMNGNDVINVYEQTKGYIEYIRKNPGPIFIEFQTYRWREHCGPNYDNHLGYRPEEEFQEWKKRCPLKRMERLLLKEEILSAEEITSIEQEIDVQIQDSVSFAKESPFPEKNELKKFLYAD